MSADLQEAHAVNEIFNGPFPISKHNEENSYFKKCVSPSCRRFTPIP